MSDHSSNLLDRRLQLSESKKRMIQTPPKGLQRNDGSNNNNNSSAISLGAVPESSTNTSTRPPLIQRSSSLNISASSFPALPPNNPALLKSRSEGFVKTTAAHTPSPLVFPSASPVLSRGSSQSAGGSPSSSVKKNTIIVQLPLAQKQLSGSPVIAVKPDSAKPATSTSSLSSSNATLAASIASRSKMSTAERLQLVQQQAAAAAAATAKADSSKQRPPSLTVKSAFNFSNSGNPKRKRGSFTPTNRPATPTVRSRTPSVADGPTATGSRSASANKPRHRKSASAPASPASSSTKRSLKKKTAAKSSTSKKSSSSSNKKRRSRSPTSKLFSIPDAAAVLKQQLEAELLESKRKSQEIRARHTPTSSPPRLPRRAPLHEVLSPSARKSHPPISLHSPPPPTMAEVEARLQKLQREEAMLERAAVRLEQQRQRAAEEEEKKRLSSRKKPLVLKESARNSSNSARSRSSALPTSSSAAAGTGRDQLLQAGQQTRERVNQLKRELEAKQAELKQSWGEQEKDSNANSVLSSSQSTPRRLSPRKDGVVAGSSPLVSMQPFVTPAAAESNTHPLPSSPASGASTFNFAMPSASTSQLNLSPILKDASSSIDPSPNASFSLESSSINNGDALLLASSSMPNPAASFEKGKIERKVVFVDPNSAPIPSLETPTSNTVSSSSAPAVPLSVDVNSSPSNSSNGGGVTSSSATDALSKRELTLIEEEPEHSHSRTTLNSTSATSSNSTLTSPSQMPTHHPELITSNSSSSNSAATHPSIPPLTLPTATTPSISIATTPASTAAAAAESSTVPILSLESLNANEEAPLSPRQLRQKNSIGSASGLSAQSSKESSPRVGTIKKVIKGGRFGLAVPSYTVVSASHRRKKSAETEKDNKASIYRLSASPVKPSPQATPHKTTPPTSATTTPGRGAAGNKKPAVPTQQSGKKKRIKGRTASGSSTDAPLSTGESDAASVKDDAGESDNDWPLEVPPPTDTDRLRMGFSQLGFNVRSSEVMNDRLIDALEQWRFSKVKWAYQIWRKRYMEFRFQPHFYHWLTRTRMRLAMKHYHFTLARRTLARWILTARYAIGIPPLRERWNKANNNLLLARCYEKWREAHWARFHAALNEYAEQMFRHLQSRRGVRTWLRTTKENLAFRGAVEKEILAVRRQHWYIRWHQTMNLKLHMREQSEGAIHWDTQRLMGNALTRWLEQLETKKRDKELARLERRYWLSQAQIIVKHWQARVQKTLDLRHNFEEVTNARMLVWKRKLFRLWWNWFCAIMVDRNRHLTVVRKKYLRRWVRNTCHPEARLRRKLRADADTQWKSRRNTRMHAIVEHWIYYKNMQQHFRRQMWIGRNWSDGRGRLLALHVVWMQWKKEIHRRFLARIGASIEAQHRKWMLYESLMHWFRIWMTQQRKAANWAAAAKLHKRVHRRFQQVALDRWWMAYERLVRAPVNLVNLKERFNHWRNLADQTRFTVSTFVRNTNLRRHFKEWYYLYCKVKNVPNMMELKLKHQEKMWSKMHNAMTGTGVGAVMGMLGQGIGMGGAAAGGMGMGMGGGGFQAPFGSPQASGRGLGQTGSSVFGAGFGSATAVGGFRPSVGSGMGRMPAGMGFAPPSSSSSSSIPRGLNTTPALLRGMSERAAPMNQFDPMSMMLESMQPPRPPPEPVVDETAITLAELEREVESSIPMASPALEERFSFTTRPKLQRAPSTDTALSSSGDGATTTAPSSSTNSQKPPLSRSNSLGKKSKTGADSEEMPLDAQNPAFSRSLSSQVPKMQVAADSDKFIPENENAEWQFQLDFNRGLATVERMEPVRTSTGSYAPRRQPQQDEWSQVEHALLHRIPVDAAIGKVKRAGGVKKSGAASSASASEDDKTSVPSSSGRKINWAHEMNPLAVASDSDDDDSNDSIASDPQFTLHDESIDEFDREVFRQERIERREKKAAMKIQRAKEKAQKAQEMREKQLEEEKKEAEAVAARVKKAIAHQRNLAETQGTSVSSSSTTIAPEVSVTVTAPTAIEKDKKLESSAATSSSPTSKRKQWQKKPPVPSFRKEGQPTADQSKSDSSSLAVSRAASPSPNRQHAARSVSSSPSSNTSSHLNDSHEQSLSDSLRMLRTPSTHSKKRIAFLSPPSSSKRSRSFSPSMRKAPGPVPLDPFFAPYSPAASDAPPDMTLDDLILKSPVPQFASAASNAIHSGSKPSAKQRSSSLPRHKQDLSVNFDHAGAVHLFGSPRQMGKALARQYNTSHPHSLAHFRAPGRKHVESLLGFEYEAPPNLQIQHPSTVKPPLPLAAQAHSLRKLLAEEKAERKAMKEEQKKMKQAEEEARFMHLRDALGPAAEVYAPLPPAKVEEGSATSSRRRRSIGDQNDASASRSIGRKSSFSRSRSRSRSSSHPRRRNSFGSERSAWLAVEANKMLGGGSSASGTTEAALKPALPMDGRKAASTSNSNSSKKKKAVAWTVGITDDKPTFSGLRKSPTSISKSPSSSISSRPVSASDSASARKKSPSSGRFKSTLASSSRPASATTSKVYFSGKPVSASPSSFSMRGRSTLKSSPSSKPRRMSPQERKELDHILDTVVAPTLFEQQQQAARAQKQLEKEEEEKKKIATPEPPPFPSIIPAFPLFVPPPNPALEQARMALQKSNPLFFASTTTNSASFQSSDPFTASHVAAMIADDLFRTSSAASSRHASTERRRNVTRSRTHSRNNSRSTSRTRG